MKSHSILFYSLQLIIDDLTNLLVFFLYKQSPRILFLLLYRSNKRKKREHGCWPRAQPQQLFSPIDLSIATCAVKATARRWPSRYTPGVNRATATPAVDARSRRGVDVWTGHVPDHSAPPSGRLQDAVTRSTQRRLKLFLCNLAGEPRRPALGFTAAASPRDGSAQKLPPPWPIREFCFPFLIPSYLCPACRR